MCRMKSSGAIDHYFALKKVPGILLNEIPLISLKHYLK